MKLIEMVLEDFKNNPNIDMGNDLDEDLRFDDIEEEDGGRVIIHAHGLVTGTPYILYAEEVPSGWQIIDFFEEEEEEENE